MNPATIFISIFGLFSFSVFAPAAEYSQSSSPNVLFIVVDDLRPELRCYGATHIHSPNIDQFADSGVLFTRAYCQQSVCNPSRTSLMTGLRPDSIGVTGNHIHFRSNKPDVVTLPQHFKNNGYHTQAIGKLYHGVFPDGASITKWDTMGDPESWSVPATRFGPRYYYTEDGIAAAKRVFQRVYKPKNPGPDDWTKKLVFGPATESPDVSDNTLYDGQVADAAVAALGKLKNRSQPFFLAVGFIKPHSPYIAPGKYFDLYDQVDVAMGQQLPSGAPPFAGHGSGELRRYTDQPARGPIAESSQRQVRQAYFACVSYIDAQIGRVFAELERQGLAENTIVSLYGDHGYHLGEHGLWGKTTNFELDTRVPLIVRAPGMKAAGQSSASLVELVDLYPTLAELAGLPIPVELEGISFCSLLDDPKQKTKDVALSQYPRAGGLMGYSMRTPTHRLTQWLHRESGEIRATELYAYTNGNIETENIADQVGSQSLLEKLHDEFNREFRNSRIAAKTPTLPRKKIKVACVGDSITFGYGIRDRANHSYPALLQKMLGPTYEVGNFGFSGATMLKNGHKPYREKPPFSESIEFEPDMVVINLGANDAVDTNWKHSDEFVDDYKALIDRYRRLSSKPDIFICRIPPIFPNHARFKECMNNRKSMIPMIRNVSQTESVSLIDLHQPFVKRNDLFPDGLHPNEDGALLMARNVFEALAGQPAPAVALAMPAKFEEENGTSFEETPAGKFAALKSNIGNWHNVSGRVLIDNKHASSGKQCLQIAGGEKSSVVLTIADRIRTDGQLTFLAERWTSRSPFSFRIEKQSDHQWTEIYNGDKGVRVGRAFLSRVTIPLGDNQIKRLRFTVTSPPNTGLLIDDLAIDPATSQKIKSVEVVPLALPALVGTTSALLKIKIETSGSLNPIALDEIATTLDGTTELADISDVQVYFTGSSSDFSVDTEVGSSHRARQELILKAARPLEHGVNYFWIACRLNKQANIDHFVGAACQSIKFSNGERKTINSTPSIQRMGVAVRNGGDDGVHTYRIPGLATTNKGTLIGVYDVRHRGGGDLPGDIDVGMSRSCDGGRTWEPMKIIMDMGVDPEWRYDGIGDPSVLVDRQTGAIWVAAVWSHGNRGWFGSGQGLDPEDTGQFILVNSRDDGTTWSKPINITSQVKKPEWSFLLQGPGKGITLSDGTIVFPAQYQDPPDEADKKVNRLPHSTFVFSQNHGKSWQIASGAWDDTTESQVVELNDGEIMINCRNNRAPKRAILTTTDLGKTWQQHSTHVQNLIEPGACMASLINVGRELAWRGLDGFDNDFLLFSNPDSLSGRNHMTIKASKDAGRTWPTVHRLLLDEQNGRGYSCMSMIDTETVGILYEGSQADMTFQRVKIADILNPPGAQKTSNPATDSVPAAGQSKSDSNRPDSLSVARVFGDHMVLQAGQPVRIWGKARPLTRVIVRFLGQTGRVNSDVDGGWLIELPPPKDYATDGKKLVVTSGSESVIFSDVLVGEVWFCAGQSNMELQLARTSNGAAAIGSSDDSRLRLLNFPGKARGSSGVYGADQLASLVPETYSSGRWAVSAPSSAKAFSGVGYYFARILRDELNCPIGIINVAAGGTPIESWVSINQLKQHPHLARMLNGNWLDNPVLDDWCRSRARLNLQRVIAGDLKSPVDEYGPNHSFKPGFMHSASVVPFQPMSIRGVLWYQGESNADNRNRIAQYGHAFPFMVESWRSEFKNADLPFIFVQLPALNRPCWPIFRETQRRCLSKLDNTGMAITIDLGELNNVHPTNKQPVAERLANWALAEVYDRQKIASGPLFEEPPERSGNKLVLNFRHKGDGLKSRDGEQLRHFELAGRDERFHPARARITAEDRIELYCESVRSPVHARYAWLPFPDPPTNLVNSNGIPASPFTTQKEY